jgi:hypothetical protein
MVRDRCGVDRDAERDGELVGRQLPQPAEQAVRSAPRQDDLATGLDPHERARDHRQLRRALARRDHRQIVLPAGRRRGALAHDRADQTAGLIRSTDRRPELHQPLVQIAGGRRCRQRGHQLIRRGPQRLSARGRLDVVLDREGAGEHARDVAIDQRRALAERDRRDRPGGVGPDATAATRRTARRLPARRRAGCGRGSSNRGPPTRRGRRRAARRRAPTRWETAPSTAPSRGSPSPPASAAA